MDMQTNIFFQWRGKNYKVGMEAYKKKYIVLPDGTALKPSRWIETYPPKPENLKKHHHLFLHFSAEDISKYLGGIVAEEIKK